MSRHTVDQFIDRTSELLSANCGGDVALSSILEACEAQKGSLYHFFPGGKDELLAAATLKQAKCAEEHILMCLDKSMNAAIAIQKHVDFLAALADQSANTIGMPFIALAATIGASNEAVRQACEYAISRIESLFANQLVADGFAKKEAKELASFSIMSIDGAILLTRSHGNSKPLKLVSKRLYRLFSMPS